MAPRQRPPDFTRKLARTIKRHRGPAAQLDTLADAAQLIADLDQFRQVRPVWDRAAEMILIAATTGKAADVQEATRQMLAALEHENWVSS